MSFSLSHTTLKVCRGTLLASGNFPLSKLFKHKREGVTRTSVEHFLPHRTETFCTWRLLYYRIFPVWKISMDERGLCQEKRSKSFCLTVPKKIRGTPLYFTENTESKRLNENNYGWYHKLVTIFFVSQYVKTCRVTHLSFKKFPKTILSMDKGKGLP